MGSKRGGWYLAIGRRRLCHERGRDGQFSGDGVSGEQGAGPGALRRHQDKAGHAQRVCNASVDEDEPARLYASADTINWHTTYDGYTFDSGTGLSQTYFTVEDFVFNWAEGDGGVLTDTVSNWWANAGDSGWGTVKQQVNWPADTYIPSQNGDITSSVWTPTDAWRGPARRDRRSVW